MTRPDSPLDLIDYTALDFPSDRVTLRDVRRAHPGRFDVESGDRFLWTNDDADFGLNDLLQVERLLARAAFESALGKPRNLLEETEVTRDDCVSELTKLYAQYGISEGRQSTEQLVRGIERQAAEQAGTVRR